MSSELEAQLERAARLAARLKATGNVLAWIGDTVIQGINAYRVMILAFQREADKVPGEPEAPAKEATLQ